MRMKFSSLMMILKQMGMGQNLCLKLKMFYEMLTTFQMFYYFNGRLPLSNGLLILPDGETPEGTEKINLNLFCEMFKETNSHSLVSIQFLSVLGIFLGFIFLYQDMQLQNYTITFHMKL